MVALSTLLQTTKLFATDTTQNCLPVNSNPVHCTGFHVDFYTYPYSSKEGLQDYFYRDGYKEIGQLTGSADGVSDINFWVSPKKDEVINIYGVPVVGSNFAMEITGWFRASQTGLYAFDLSRADDGLSFQIGFNENRNISCCGSDLNRDISTCYSYFRRNVDDESHIREVYLTRGVYYPVRMVYYQRWGEAEISFKYTMPDGTIKETFDEVCHEPVLCETMQSSSLSLSRSTKTASSLSRPKVPSVMSSVELAAISHSISSGSLSSHTILSSRSQPTLHSSSHHKTGSLSSYATTTKVPVSTELSRHESSTWSSTNTYGPKTWTTAPSSMSLTSKTQANPTINITTSSDLSGFMTETRGLLEQDVVMPVLPTKVRDSDISQNTAMSTEKGSSSSIGNNIVQSKYTPRGYSSSVLIISRISSVSPVTTLTTVDASALWTSTSSSHPSSAIGSNSSHSIGYSKTRSLPESVTSNADASSVSQTSHVSSFQERTKISMVVSDLPTGSLKSVTTVARTSSKLSASELSPTIPHVNSNTSSGRVFSSQDKDGFNTLVNPTKSQGISASTAIASRSGPLPAKSHSDHVSTLQSTLSSRYQEWSTKTAAPVLSTKSFNEPNSSGLQSLKSSVQSSKAYAEMSQLATVNSVSDQYQLPTSTQSSNEAPVLLRTTSIPITLEVIYPDDKNRGQVTKVSSLSNTSGVETIKDGSIGISNSASSINGCYRWVLVLAISIIA